MLAVLCWAVLAPQQAFAQSGPSRATAQSAPATDALIDYVMSLDERTLRLIQSRLFDLGYYRGQPHGVADEATFKAILNFHQTHAGPVETLSEQIRDAASARDVQGVDGDGQLHLRHGEDPRQKPLCLDLPGRSDCQERGA